MVDVVALKDYLNKLQKLINFDATFSFSCYKLVKKSRIDDIMCCIYATLPDSYKRMLKTKKDIQRYKSVLCYGMLAKLLAKKFFLDKNLCIINITEVNKLISNVTLSIERDINAIEQDFDS